MEIVVEDEIRLVPEANSLKMFVGQIPRHMAEPELIELFSEFGRVFSVNVLRDQDSGISKGCCFVQFYMEQAAKLAEKELHNKRILTPNKYPLQVSQQKGMITVFSVQLFRKSVLKNFEIIF